MTIHEQKHGAVTVLIPEGPLIQADAERFKERAVVTFSKSLGRFVVDASKMPFIDSKGLESLLDINDHLAQSGQALKLCSLNKTIREVLDLTDLSSSFEQYEDITTAVRSFL
jgi:anti-anti-sigma factor